MEWQSLKISASDTQVNKSVPVLWLETVNVCFFLFADVIELKQEGKKIVFFLFNIYQNIISKRAAKRSCGDPISDGGELQKQQTCQQLQELISKNQNGI